MPKYEKTDSGKWRTRLTWTDSAGRHAKSFTAETQRELRQMVFDFSQKLTTDSTHLRVSDAVEKYIDVKAPVLSPSTLKGYRALLPRFAPIGSVWLENLDVKICQRFISDLSAELSPKTVRNIWGLFSATLKMFYPGFMPSVKLPQKLPPSVVIPTADEVAVIVFRAREKGIALPVMLAAFQGMRMSEIIGLRWSRVDLEAGTLTVDAARVAGCDNQFHTKAPKTAAGARVLSLMPAVIDELRNTPQISEYVVPLTSYQIKARYNRINKKCGYSFTFHELRHFACSVALSLNIPASYVAKMLGHEGENMVRRVYGHIMGNANDEFYARLKDYYAKVTP